VTGPRLVLVALCALHALGCQRKALPSEQYTQAHQLFSKLYGTQLDDAYADSQMNAVENLLNQVPAGSSDATSAQELLRRIAEGRARIQARREEQRNTLNQALATAPYERFPEERTKEKAPPAATPDGGAGQPIPGMSLSEFTQRFSGCFQAAEPIVVAGMGVMDSWELKNIANCRDRHPGFDGMVVLTDGKQVSMNVSKSQVKWNSPDAGRPEQRQQEASAR
jgi:sRNA-binding protein